MYGLETVAITTGQERILEVAEMRMLRFSIGYTRKDRIKNENIRKRLGIRRFGRKLQEARLRWFGHVQRKEDTFIGRKVLEMGLPGRQRRGRPRRYMNTLKEDLKKIGAVEGDWLERKKWRQMIRCGDP